MKKAKLLLLLLVLPVLAFTSEHKYYISHTQIDYIQDKQSVQITSRIFIDDFENVLRERYNENITLTGKDELEITDAYIEKYLKEKIKIKINNKAVVLTFIGKAYDADIMKCYLEIENIEAIKSFEVTNQVLFDLFDDQQNIVKTKINSKQKSFLLVSQNDVAVLNFN